MRMNFAAPLSAVLLCLASNSAAEQPTLSLAGALDKTLRHGPTLQDYPYRLRLHEAQRLQATLRPNPELSVSLENVAGTGDSAGLNNAELTLTLSQLIERGHKRQLRLATTEWQEQLLHQQFDISKLDALAATARSYIRQLERQQIKHQLKQRLHREQRLLAIASMRAAASSLSDSDVTRLEIRLTRSKLELSAVENAIELGRATLAAHWASPPDFSEVTGSLSQLPLLPALAELKNSLLQSPVLDQFVTQQRLHEAELNLANAAQKADVTFSAGLRRDQSVNDTSVVLAVSAPWQLQDSTAAQRLTAKTQLELNALQQQQSHRQLNLLVTQTYLELEQLRQYSKVLQAQLLPKARKLLQLSELGYQQGQVDLFNLLSAEQELTQAEVDLVNTQSRFHQQLLELERLTGQALTVSGPVRFSVQEP